MRTKIRLSPSLFDLHDCLGAAVANHMRIIRISVSGFYAETHYLQNKSSSHCIFLKNTFILTQNIVIIILLYNNMALYMLNSHYIPFIIDLADELY